MSSGSSKRAKRRAALARKKHKAKQIYWFAPPIFAIKLANHLASCSRYCCGNRRRYDGPTKTEKMYTVQDSQEAE